MCYRRGNRNPRCKTSLPPSKRKVIHQKMQLEYMNSNRLSKPNLPNVPKPSKLLAPTRLRRLGCESGRILLRKDRKLCALSSPEDCWAKAQKGKIQPFQSVVRHSKSAELALGHQMLFRVRVPFGLLFQGFLTGPCTQTCFHPPSMIFYLFFG